MHVSTTHLLWRCICTFLHILESLQGPHGYAVLKLVILSMKNNGVNVFTTVIPFIVFMTSPIISKLFSKASEHQMWEFWKNKSWNCRWVQELKLQLQNEFDFNLHYLLFANSNCWMAPHLYKESENLKKTFTYPVLKNVLYIWNLLYFRNLWKNI